jgi:hypothetical protein
MFRRTPGSGRDREVGGSARSPLDRIAIGWLALAAGALAALASGALFFSFERPWSLRGDNKLGILPMVAEAYRQWSEGRLPTWTNGQWGGFPLLADPQATALYPPNLLALALVPHPHLRALDLATALHFGLLAAGCVCLLVELGAGRRAALFGAALTLVTPQLLWWTSFLTAFEALCWWPWLFLAAERLTHPERKALREAILGSLALGAQVLAGYAEYAFYGGCVAGIWILCAASGLGFSERVRRALLLGLAGVLLSAPQIAPTLFGIGGTLRAVEPDHLSFLAIGAGGFASVVDPRSGSGPPWAGAFLGAATLLLAGCALVGRAPRSPLLALLALAGALLALGDRTPAYALLVWLPPFHLFRGPVKFYVVTCFAVVWLAALGLETLRRRGGYARWIGTGLACAAVLEYGVHFARHFPQLGRPHTADEALLPDALEPLHGVLPLLRPDDPPQVPPRVLLAQGPGRYGSLPMLLGVELLNGGPVSSLAGRQARLLGDAPSALTRAHLDLFGAQLVLVPGPCARFRGRGLVPIDERDGICVLRNPSGPERYMLAAATRNVASEDEMLALAERDPAGPVPVVTPSQTPSPREPGGEAGSVVVAAYVPGRVQLVVDARRPGLLLARESWSRGWHATSDGAPAPVHPAAGLFFAVPVEAGRHRIELRFEPPGLTLGLVGFCAWCVLAAIASRGVLSRRQSARRAVGPRASPPPLAQRQSADSTLRLAAALAGLRERTRTPGSGSRAG